MVKVCTENRVWLNKLIDNNITSFTFSELPNEYKSKEMFMKSISNNALIFEKLVKNNKTRKFTKRWRIHESLINKRK